ncbi:substrate-binding periplasmic protein [Marinomonas sp. GJ51-6]|uniref:substrate-binding periplasmic protein n=1 Tax=Marinomonas sp. GJ51-6 TaxID=2992802 RepID=UPI0029348870|nr:transporter substrate-binding domain-containing protein [Marinomonas sp. GJ51-6]WOD08625.1 transporter substrate-binding domain-containing protein [Marinomonas sp. GJ51-6]
MSIRRRFLNAILCVLSALPFALAESTQISLEENVSDSDKTVFAKTGDAELRPTETKEIVLCGHPDYPPVSWAEEGKIVGLAPAIVKQIFQHLDYKVDAKAVGNWKRCLRELELGRVDLAVAYRTQERENLFDFSHEAVIDDPMAIFVNRNHAFPFESWSDLLGKTTGLMLGDSVGNSFDNFLADNLVIERVSKASQNFGKLGRGHIDFIPYGLHAGNLLIQQFGLSDRIVALPNLAITNQYYLAVSRKSDLNQYLDLIDAELQKMHKSGDVKRLTDRYIQIYSAKNL